MHYKLFENYVIFTRLSGCPICDDEALLTNGSLYKVLLMNIFFRVDSSTQVGTGHLRRCLTLADELKNQGHAIYFICRDLEGHLIKSIPHPVLGLSRPRQSIEGSVYAQWLGVSQKKDAEETIAVLPVTPDYLVVDSYSLDIVWHQTLRSHTKKIMVIDDLFEGEFDCDILLNQNLGVNVGTYSGKVSKTCRLFLGPEYALLRSEFATARAQSIEKREKTQVIKNVLIFMGGVDAQNYTKQILEQLEGYFEGCFEFTVVLTKISPHIESVKKYIAKKENKNIKLLCDVSRMQELMLDADIAIGAGGTTSWERCCLGLPTLLFITADNQKNVARQLEKAQAVKCVANIEALSKTFDQVLSNFTLWKEMSRNSYNLCDGKGAQRMAKYFLSQEG